MTNGERHGPDTAVPLVVRVQFAHAALQWLADEQGLDILHIKGSATDSDLRTRSEGGSDADILVRPDHVGALLDELWSHGWRRLSSFHTGSPFGHAVTAVHPQFVHADVHRFFPGMDADPLAAFDALWAGRQMTELAGIPCSVPSRTAQVLIRVLNSARSTRRQWAHTEICQLLPGEDPGPLMELVRQTRAEVGFAAATGDLERYRGDARYPLWKVTTQGGTRTQEWLARVHAAPNWSAKAALVARAPLVNRDHLRTVLGHEPSPVEVVREFFARPARGARQECERRRRPPRAAGGRA